MQREVMDGALAKRQLPEREARAHPDEIVAEESDVVEHAAALSGAVPVAVIILQARGILGVDADHMHHRPFALLEPDAGEWKVRTPAFSKAQHIRVKGARGLDNEVANGNMIETVDAHGLSLQTTREALWSTLENHGASEPGSPPASASAIP